MSSAQRASANMPPIGQLAQGGDSPQKVNRHEGIARGSRGLKPWQQEWQQCDGTKPNDMELNSGRRSELFSIVELCGTVWNGAPISPKPQGAGAIPVPPAPKARFHGDYRPVSLTRRGCVDPYSTPMSDHQIHHRRSWHVDIWCWTFWHAK